MSNCLDVNSKFECPKISHIEPVRENINRTGRLTLPIFSTGSGLFLDYGKLWCLNRENQHNCVPNENFILEPKPGINPGPSAVNNNKIYSYSNNIKNNLFTDNILNIGRKVPSTGTNANARSTYSIIDNENNPYPDNVDFTPDGISLSKLNAKNVERIKYCNNRSIQNRFRPVFLHIPDKFLEICEPKGYRSGPDLAPIE